jgi:GNAT superfamily N-acetyltransferase
MSFHIRVITAADIPRLTELVKAYWAFERIADFNASRIEALLADLLAHPERGTCWVADDGAELSGYLLAVYMFSLEHGGMMAEIDELFVLPHHRSSGTGTALLTAAEQFMKARALVRVQLQLGTDNELARQFYVRHGYEPRAGFNLFDKGIP